MIRRVLLVLVAGLVLNTTGCALLGILAVPFELLISVFSAIGDGLGAAADAVVHADAIQGPAPVVERVEGGSYALRSVRPDARFEVVCRAPGCAERRLRWPADLAALMPASGGRVEVPVVLARADGG